MTEQEQVTTTAENNQTAAVERDSSQIQVVDVSNERASKAEDEFLDKNLPIGGEKTTDKRESKQQDAEAAKPKGYDKAVKALKLDGWDDDDVSALSEERIIALGKKAQERHSAIGKKLQEKSSKSADLDIDDEDDSEQGEEKGFVGNDDDSESEEQGSAEPARQPRAKDGKFVIDYKALAKPVSEAIGLGDEVEEALAKAFESALAPIQEKVAAYDEYQSQLIEQRGEEIGQAARERLADRFPGLKDEEKFERVVTRMYQLAKTEQEYESMEQLMLDAAKLELFDDNTQASKRLVSQSKRAQGQPTTVSRKMPVSAMELEDKEDAVIDALLAGKGRDAARKTYYGHS